MIEKKNLVAIGKFQKTHALKGEMNAILDVDPSYMNDGNPLIVDVDGIPVPFYVESLRTKGSSSYLVKLEGVDSSDEAREFVNKEIYALKDVLGEYFQDDEEEFFFGDDLEGFRVIDSRLGDIGSVTRVDDSTENVLLVVEDTAGEEIFIPFVETFINDVDEEKQEIHTDLPEGLVDLNVKSKE